LTDSPTLRDLTPSLFGWRDAAVEDHPLSQCDGGRLVDVVAVDVFAMRETVAGRIFDAPGAVGSVHSTAAQLWPAMVSWYISGAPGR
jgi:hypothetical protein